MPESSSAFAFRKNNEVQLVTVQGCNLSCGLVGYHRDVDRVHRGGVHANEDFVRLKTVRVCGACLCRGMTAVAVISATHDATLHAYAHSCALWRNPHERRGEKKGVEDKRERATHVGVGMVATTIDPPIVGDVRCSTSAFIVAGGRDDHAPPWGA